jgi:ABC-type lipoprotein export system ATPase subunit
MEGVFEHPMGKLQKDKIMSVYGFENRVFNISEVLEVQEVKTLRVKLGNKRRFKINVRYKTKTKITPRTVAVAEAFGIGLGEGCEFVVYDNLELWIGEEDIVYITGDSGSGKSALLRALEQALGPKAMNIKNVLIDKKRPLIDTIGKNVNEGLELLSRVGLNDAYLFVRRYYELSDGQKYRYRLAKLIESEAQFWIADEFGSTLDRDTAKIVAFNAQKIARQERKGLIVATCNRDLFDDLGPSVYIVKDFGQRVQVHYLSSPAPAQCSLVSEMKVTEGTIEDYKKLSHFHYRSSYLVAPKKIFALKRKNETIGVIVYASPPAICFGRSKYFGRPLKVDEVNEKLLIISRVIIHPKYRTIGLGVKLVKETLPLAGSPYVEAVAVMARYNPFFEKAGMKKVAEKKPDERLVKLKTELEKLGFGQPFLSSVGYNANKLRKLAKDQIEGIKRALIECKHFFLRKIVIGKKECRSKLNEKEKWKIYAKKVQNMSPGELARILSIVARLTQVKVYLIWSQKKAKPNLLIH